MPTSFPNNAYINRASYARKNIFLAATLPKRTSFQSSYFLKIYPDGLRRGFEENHAWISCGVIEVEAATYICCVSHRAGVRGEE